MPAAGPNRWAIFGGLSIWSMGQSSIAIEASYKRPSSGTASFARAMLIRAARSDPNQGLARAPFTGLRVVAIRSVGLVVSSAASKRVAVPASDAHPSSANADAPDASTRNMLRRDNPVETIMSIAHATSERPPPSLRQPWLMPDRGDSRAPLRPSRGIFAPRTELGSTPVDL